MTHQHDFVGSLTTSIITAAVALLPVEALNYAEKVISVFILAIVAEAGRRLVGAISAKLKS